MDRRAAAALVAVQILFGLWPVAAPAVFPHVGTLGLAAVRTAGAAAVLWALHPLLVRTPVAWRRERWSLAGLALLGVVANQGLFLWGLSLTNPVNAIVMVTTIPVFTYAIAVAGGRERLGPRRALGIALAFLGAFLLVGASGLEGGARQAAGDALVALNALSFAAFLVYSKPLNERYDPLSVTAGVFLVGCLFFLPLGLATGLVADLGAAPGAVWGILAFVVLGPTVGTYVLNATALRTVASSTVAVFIYLQPIVTALAAWLLLATVPSWRVLPAAALVFAGVWLVARRRPPVLRGRAVVA